MVIQKTVLMYTLDTLGIDPVKFEASVHKRLKKKFEVEKDNGGNEYYRGDVRKIYSVIYKYWRIVYKEKRTTQIEESESSEESSIEYNSDNIPAALEKFRTKVKLFDNFKLVRESGEYGMWECIDEFWTYLSNSKTLDRFGQLDGEYKTKLIATSVKFNVDPDILFVKHLHQSYYDKGFVFRTLEPGVNLVRGKSKGRVGGRVKGKIYILDTNTNQLKKLGSSDNISNNSQVVCEVDVESWNADPRMVELVFHNDKSDDILLAKFIRKYRAKPKAVYLKLRETLFKPSSVVTMLRLLGINAQVYAGGGEIKVESKVILIQEKLDTKNIHKIIAKGVTIMDISEATFIKKPSVFEASEIKGLPICLSWIKLIADKSLELIPCNELKYFEDVLGELLEKVGIDSYEQGFIAKKVHRLEERSYWQSMNYRNGDWRRKDFSKIWRKYLGEDTKEDSDSSEETESSGQSDRIIRKYKDDEEVLIEIGSAGDNSE